MERRSFVLIGLMVLAGACFPVGSARAQEDAEGGARAQEDVEGLDGLTKTSVRDSIQGPDINVTDGGQKAPVNLRDVWILQNRLSGEDVDDILGQTRTLIDTDGSFGPIANTGIHSELGRQLSVLMKAREDVFTSDKSVDGMFDDLFGSSTGSASSSSTPSVAHLEELIESYTQLLASLEALKGYSVLAQGPLVTYKGGVAGDGQNEMVTLAREDLTRARENAKASVDAIRDTLASILK